MKIAVISMIHESWGGSEELWAAMAHKALDEGIEVIHSTFHFDNYSAKEQCLVERGMTHVTRRGFTKPGISTAMRLSRKTIDIFASTFRNPFSDIIQAKPDYILYNGTCYSIGYEKYLAPILLESSIPFGIIAHYNDDSRRTIMDIEANIIRKVFAKAKNIFFVSKRTIVTAERHLATTINNAVIVRNPVNIMDLSTAIFPKFETANIAMVGNLRVIHKGQDIVISILSAKKWQGRSWQLNVYGSGEDELYLKQLVDFYGLNDRINFHGRVTDINKVWEENHLLLMPSLMEGMPLAVVEAMLCGRPSIVTDVGGHTEWISDDIEGFVAAAPSLNAVSDAMERAWLKKDHWNAMGQAARQKALGLYDPTPGKTLLTQIKKAID